MRFPVSSATLNSTEQRATAQVGSYESIKAKIDRGINRQVEGRKEVSEGIKEMIESEAYTKKYKTIAAFAEHEYGKSARWITHMLAELIPATETNKPESAEPPKPTNTPNKPASATVTNTSAPTSNGTPAKPKPPMDLSGCVIPQRLLLILERSDEVKESCQWASKLKCLFERLQTEPDPLFAHVKQAGSIQTFMTGAATMRYQLSECSPDVVCPECSGKSDSCGYCDGTGWICEVRWNRDWVKSNDRLRQGEVAKRAANL